MVNSGSSPILKHLPLFPGKKKRILFIRVLQITSKQTTIYGTYLSAWQSFVSGQALISSPPRQPSRNMRHENCKHIDKMRTRGNTHSFILTVSCKTSWGRAWYLFAMEMTVRPLVFEITSSPPGRNKMVGKNYHNCTLKQKILQFCRTGQMEMLFIRVFFVVGLTRTSRYLALCFFF